ncbi:MAG: hypothetical protein HYV09_23545 [Deltaproteobacteria bacterium]|nr:hypothetical protein [Deltaproteobacteria bacterium]
MDARERLVEELSAVAAAGEGPARVDHATRAARLAGALACRGEARGFHELDERARRTVRVDVLTLDLSDLERGARVLRALPHALADEAVFGLVRALLARRTDVEMIRRGVGALLGHTFEWSESQAARVRAFDDAAEEVAYQLIAFNDTRARLLEGVAPKLRDDLWWLSRGVELPADTVAHLGHVAALVAEFPPARALFDDRVRAAEQQQRARPGGSTRRISRGFSLDAFIGERADAELQLLRAEAVTLSLVGGDVLAARVHGALRIGERPRVRTARGERSMEPVPGSRTQFELPLDRELRHASSLSLVIPFTDRELVVDVLRALEPRR